MPRNKWNPSSDKLSPSRYAGSTLELGGVRINLNEAITELNLPRLICIHPVNSIIYVNAAEVLELIRLPVRTSSFPRRGSGSEMEEGKSVRKRREKKGKLK